MARHPATSDQTLTRDPASDSSPLLARLTSNPAGTPATGALKFDRHAANVYVTQNGRGLTKIPGCSEPCRFVYAFTDRPVLLGEVSTSGGPSSPAHIDGGGASFANDPCV